LNLQYIIKLFNVV